MAAPAVATLVLINPRQSAGRQKGAGWSGNYRSLRSFIYAVSVLTPVGLACRFLRENSAAIQRCDGGSFASPVLLLASPSPCFPHDMRGLTFETTWWRFFRPLSLPLAEKDQYLMRAHPPHMHPAACRCCLSVLPAHLILWSLLPALVGAALCTGCSCLCTLRGAYLWTGGLSPAVKPLNTSALSYQNNPSCQYPKRNRSNRK